MVHDERAVERIRGVLAGRTDVVEKRMVSGRSFMVRGHLCCGVTGADLMVRVGQAAYESALAQPHARPMQLGGRSLIGYVLVAPEGYEEPTALAAWLQQGIDFVSTLPARGS